MKPFNRKTYILDFFEDNALENSSTLTLGAHNPVVESVNSESEEAATEEAATEEVGPIIPSFFDTILLMASEDEAFNRIIVEAAAQAKWKFVAISKVSEAFVPASLVVFGRTLAPDEMEALVRTIDSIEDGLYPESTKFIFVDNQEFETDFPAELIESAPTNPALEDWVELLYQRHAQPLEIEAFLPVVPKLIEQMQGEFQAGDWVMQAEAHGRLWYDVAVESLTASCGPGADPVRAVANRIMSLLYRFPHLVLRCDEDQSRLSAPIGDYYQMWSKVKI